MAKRSFTEPEKAVSPEDIIIGTDPVAIEFLRQIYGAINDISKERRSFIENCWLNGIDKAYKNPSLKLDTELCFKLLERIYKHLEDKDIWDVNEKDLYEIFEKIISLKATRDSSLKEVFDQLEQSVVATLQLDFSHKIPLNETFKDKRNIFNYIVLLFNSVVEKMELSTVSAKSVNTYFSKYPDVAFITTNEEGKIRFSNHYAAQILGSEEILLLDASMKDLVKDYSRLIENFEKDGMVDDFKTTLIPVTQGSKSIPVSISIPKPIKDRSEVEEIAFIIKLADVRPKKSNISKVGEIHENISTINSMGVTTSMLKKKLMDKESRQHIELLEKNIDLLKKKSIETLHAISGKQNDAKDTIHLGKLIEKIIKKIKLSDKLEDVEIQNNMSFLPAIKSNHKIIELAFESLLQDAITSRKPFEKTKLILDVKEKKNGIMFLFHNQQNSMVNASVSIQKNKGKKTSKNKNGWGYLVAKESIEELGGEIELFSSSNTGSIITGFIPCVIE